MIAKIHIKAGEVKCSCIFVFFFVRFRGCCGVLGVCGMVIRLFVSHKSFRFFFLPL